jgi:predicted  nucleic acid-binding Zn-ribbon protein
MKASREQQLKLLDLQALDTAISQLNHRIKTSPEAKELDELRAAIPVAQNELINRQTAVADLQLLVKRADADVEQVRMRIDRDSKLIDGGTLSAKDLVNMQHELETLKRRQATLEDEELEIMSQVETAQKEVVTQEEVLTQLKSKFENLSTVVDGIMAEINSEKSEKQRQVDEMRSGLDSELLKLYDKIKSDHAGVGAAQLNGKTCNGCRIEISATDLATINSALDDELIRCDECRRILVR